MLEPVQFRKLEMQSISVIELKSVSGKEIMRMRLAVSKWPHVDYLPAILFDPSSVNRAPVLTMRSPLVQS